MNELAIEPPAVAATSTGPKPGYLQRRVLRWLETLRAGSLALRDGRREYHFGNPQSDVEATIHVHRPAFYRRVALGGEAGAAQALLDGDWSCSDLTALVRIFLRNEQTAGAIDRGTARLVQWLWRAAYRLRRNTRRGSARNIHDHYDLGNEFFALFLDDTLSYSCGWFDRPDGTLLEASLAKLERVCRKLDLRPDHHLLEIGSGWGGLAVYAAQQFGCRVTTTTISREQHHTAVERVRAAGLSDRVDVRLDDYRDLTGTYDKLVSIEMIEAVGPEYYRTFFRKCGELLRPDGVMLLQGIVMNERRYADYLRGTDFVRSFVFPGGTLPSVLTLGAAAAGASDLRLIDLDDMTPHYVQTLAAWRSRFLERLDDARSLGYPERFLRLWEFYLSYCEAAFAERRTQTVQMMFAGPEHRGEGREGTR